VVNLEVDYLGNFVFWFSIDDYRYRQRFRTLLKVVGCGWLEHRDMEHKMDGSHGVWKTEYERLWTGLSNYLIWSKVLFGEFFR